MRRAAHPLRRTDCGEPIVANRVCEPASANAGNFKGPFNVPRLTIIIPATGDDQRLEETLGSVLRHRPADCEVVVAHDGAYADPYDLGDEVRFVSIRPGASITALLNVGLGATRAPWLHFLWPGCEVSEHWTDAAASHFREANVAAVAPWVGLEETGAVGCVYRVGGRRSANSESAGARGGAVLSPLARAAFFRAESLRAIGGFDECLGPDWTMIDASLALHRRGETVVGQVHSRVFAEHSPVKESGGAFRQARDAERVFWRHSASFAHAVAHAGHVIGDSLRAIASLTAPAVVVGRAMGAIDAARGKRGSGVIRSAESDGPMRPHDVQRESGNAREARGESAQGEEGQGQTVKCDANAWRTDRPHAAREPRAARSISAL